jgi:hypothetical protein
MSLKRSLDYGTWYIHLINHETMIPSRVCPDLDSGEYLQLTLFPSQHCPGSVVFIFEGYFGKYVYTGDIRLEPDLGLGTFPSFVVDLDVASDDMLIPWSKLTGADRLFMDTTFAGPLWEHFPQRMEAINQVISLIESLPDRNQRVLLECDMLGTEQVLIGVSEHFGKPFYVERKLYIKLAATPGLKKFLTKSNSETRFFAVPHGTFSKGNLDKTHSANDIARSIHSIQDGCFIKPSTQWFGANSFQRILDTKPVLRNGVWHVLYSIHSSYSEMRNFITRIQPQTISPLVTLDQTILKEIESLCSPIVRYESVSPISKMPPSIASILKLENGIKESFEVNGEAKDSKNHLLLLTPQKDNVLDDSIDLSMFEFQSNEIEPIIGTAIDPTQWQSKTNSRPVKTLFDDISDQGSNEFDSSDVLQCDDSSSKSSKLRAAPDLDLTIFDIVSSETVPLLIPPLKKRCENLNTSQQTQIVLDLTYHIEDEQ